MDVGSGILSGLLALAILLAALAAAAEVALAAVSRLGMRDVLAGRQPRGQAADQLVSEPARFLSTLLVFKVLCFAGAGAATALLALKLGGGSLILWSLIGLVLVTPITQVLARAWAIGRQEALAVALGPAIHVLAFFLRPVTFLLEIISRGATPAGMSPESLFLSEGGLRFLFEGASEEETIEDEEKEMIASIFEFGETLVREVMVPRIDIEAVPVETPIPDAVDVILRAGHSRIPVYKDTIDNVVGTLYAKDLLRYLRDARTDVGIDKILRPTYFIPESKKVDELLEELQQRRVHMAVVVDEYGGTAGLVTIEDLLEEIVGEIQDEYDAEEPKVEAVNEHDYLFDARVPLDEVSKLMEVALPEEGGDTLGGFIYSQLGRVPAVGDTIQFGGVQVEVLSVAGRRIKQVRASRMATVTENGHEGPGPVAFAPFGLHLG